MKNIFKHLPVFFLILLYVYAVTSKLGDINQFRGQLYNQTFPHALADFLLVALPAAEVLTAALLFFSRSARAGLLLSLALLSVFTAYIILVKLHFWARVPCSCGGILSQMSWTTHLVFNLFFLVLNLLAILIQKGEAENLEQSRQHQFI
jgi:putative oxidoreductase